MGQTHPNTLLRIVCPVALQGVFLPGFFIGMEKLGMWLIRDFLYLFAIVFTDSESHGVIPCDPRSLKGDASRFVWQNRLFLCLNCQSAVWSLKSYGAKGIFFFTSAWILEVAPAPSSLCVHLFNPRTELTASTCFLVQSCCSWSSDLQDSSTGLVPVPSTVKTWRDCFCKQLLPFLHSTYTKCFLLFMCSVVLAGLYPLPRINLISGVGDSNCVFAI